MNITKKLFPLFIALMVVLAACGPSEEAEMVDPDQLTEMETPPEIEADIVDVAVSSGLTTFASMVDLAGLTETLREDGPYTVFAPTDEAFETLGHDTLQQLADPENIEELQAILLYHVVAGVVTAQEVLERDEITTAAEHSITIELTEFGEILLDGAVAISVADVEAGNGVIHIIDAVMIPTEE